MKKTVLYILFLTAFALAKGGDVCTVDSVAWVSEHDAFDEVQMETAKGAPCDSWKPLADKLVRYYENSGFVAARLQGTLNETDGKHV